MSSTTAIMLSGATALSSIVIAYFTVAILLFLLYIVWPVQNIDK